MAPILRLHLGVTIITVSLMYWGILHIPESSSFVGFTITGLVTIGTYRTLLKGFLWLTSQSRWLKRISLGSIYLEGRWEGTLTGKGGKEYRIIEH